MGHVSHHAIIVTGWDDDLVGRAHAMATSKGLLVTQVVGSNVNTYRSFLVVPDGSNEGWDDDEAGDQRRAEFKAAMRESPFVEPGEDGPLPRVSWVEVHFDRLDDRWDVGATVVDADRRNDHSECALRRKYWETHG